MHKTVNQVTQDEYTANTVNTGRLHSSNPAKKTLQIRVFISTSYQRQFNEKFQSTSLYQVGKYNKIDSK